MTYKSLVIRICLLILFMDILIIGATVIIHHSTNNNPKLPSNTYIEKGNKILHNIPDDEFSKGVIKNDKKLNKMTNEEWKKKNHFKEYIPICEHCKYFYYELTQYGDVPCCRKMPDKQSNIVYETDVCDKFTSLEE